MSIGSTESIHIEFDDNTVLSVALKLTKENEFITLIDNFTLICIKTN